MISTQFSYDPFLKVFKLELQIYVFVKYMLLKMRDMTNIIKMQIREHGQIQKLLVVIKYCSRNYLFQEVYMLVVKNTAWNAMHHILVSIYI